MDRLGGVGWENVEGAKGFRGRRLDTVHDLKIIFEMARKSEHKTKFMVVDPPGPNEGFEATRVDEFLAYALERNETLF